MKEDFTLVSVSPSAYAEYLEQLSDTEFWNHAYEKAHMPHSPHALQALATVTTAPDDTLDCITCDLRTAQCVLPLTIIREILPLPYQLTLLPDMPYWMLGIFSWRGETIAAIDLCSYLTKSNSAPLQKRTFLIVQHEHLSLALCVLSVGSAVMAVNVNSITPFALPPVIEGGEIPVGIVGMWKHGNAEHEHMFVLDMPALFKDVVQCIERNESHE